MPLRTLRFCPQCMSTQHASAREACGSCGAGLLPLLDEGGAITREFLARRGTCCGQGCRNCPYPAAAAKGGESKSCPRCRERFACGSANCWCERVELSGPTLKWLGRTYDDCLCPTCLSEFAKR